MVNFMAPQMSALCGGPFSSAIVAGAARHCISTAQAGPHSGLGGQSSGQQGVAVTACKAAACATAGPSEVEINIPPSKTNRMKERTNTDIRRLSNATCLSATHKCMTVIRLYAARKG